MWWPFRRKAKIATFDSKAERRKVIAEWDREFNALLGIKPAPAGGSFTGDLVRAIKWDSVNRQWFKNPSRLETPVRVYTFDELATGDWSEMFEFQDTTSDSVSTARWYRQG